MNIEGKYWESDIAKDGEMDMVEFVVCSEDEDTDTASSEDDYSDTDSDFVLFCFCFYCGLTSR